MPLYIEGNPVEDNISIPAQDTQETTSLTITPEQEFNTGNTTLDKLKAQFALNNSVFNLTRKAAMEIALLGEEDDPNYDAMADLDGYEDYRSRFVGTTSHTEKAYIKTQIDYERHLQNVISKGSTLENLLGGITSFTIDPLTLIPAVKGITAANLAGRIGQGLASGAVYGATSGVLREGTLFATQETHEMEDAVQGALFEAAVGAILGTAVGGLSKGARQALANDAKIAATGKDLRDFTPAGTKYEPLTDKELGGKFEGEGIANINPTIAKLVAGGIPYLQSLNFRMLSSPYSHLSALNRRLFRSNLLSDNNFKGKATEFTASNEIQKAEVRARDYSRVVFDTYTEYSGVGKLRATLGSVPEGKLSFKGFQEEITKVLDDASYKPKAEGVTTAAKAIRSMLDEAAELLVETKVLDRADLKPNYIPQVWDTKTLITKEGKESFVRDLAGRYRTHDADGAPRLKPLDAAKAEEAALESYHKILAQGDRSLALNQVADDLIKTPNFVKSREINVPRSQFGKYMNNDILEIANSQYKQALALANTRKALQDMGYDSLTAYNKGLLEEKEELLKGAKTDKERMNIENGYREAKELAELAYRASSGTLNNATHPFISDLLKYQFVRLLGGVTPSSFPEASMLIVRNGFGPLWKHAIVPMVKDFSTFKTSLNQWRHLDLSLNAEMSDILKTQLDPTDFRAGHIRNAKDKIVDTATQAAGHLFLINQWTSGLKRVAAQLASGRIIDDLLSNKVYSKIDAAEMANYGLSKDMIPRVRKMAAQYSDKVNGSYFARTELWSDTEAAKAFDNVIKNVSESTVLKPTLGDLPQFAIESSIGKLFFQFKSFMSAATSSVTLAGMQRRDMRTLQGMMLLPVLGMLSEVTQLAIRGETFEGDMDELLLRGLSRSGMLGLLGTAMLDTGLSVTGPYRRFAGDNFQSLVIGPSLSQIADVGKIIESVAGPDSMSESDYKRMKAMLPLQNLFYLRWLYNQINEE